MTLDFAAINTTLLSNYQSTLQQWFPNGQRIGADWCVGSLSGEAGKSLKIHITKGVWKDFASDEGGSDPISLYAAIHGISQSEAARRLSDMRPSDDTLKPAGDRNDIPDPTLGKYSARYDYRSEVGNLLGVVTRTDTATGKQIRPWTPWRTGTGEIIWKPKGFTDPRPLYGLNRLAMHPAAVVLVVEGEKCADAGWSIDPATPCITWSGGANAMRKTNWEPMRGRRAILWPDNDAPGIAAMRTVAEILTGLGCEVQTLKPPGDADDGWDLADAVADGWKLETLHRYLASARITEPVVVARTVTTTTATRTPEADTVQRVEVREEILPPVAPDKAAYGLQMGSGGRYIPSLDAICRIIELHPQWQGRFWWDSFLERVSTDAWGRVEPLTDHLCCRVTRWMQSVFELPTASSAMVTEAVLAVARENNRNCLTEWLESLTWDKTERLAELLPIGFGTPSNEYHGTVGTCWLTSLVARAMQPGCKVDTMPVFEGSQGAGKSSALAILGGDWFGECHEDFGSKDFVLSLKGKWLIEVAEMHSFRRADVDRLKGIISTRVDRVRVPYGRLTEEHPRQSVFAGTTNRDDWQNDDTGARRFWPVRCGIISQEWLRDNRDQLFAEAVARFKEGLDWWSIDAAAAARAADQRRPEDPWEEILDRYLIDGSVYSSRELLADPLQIDAENQSQTYATRVGRIMRRLGWERFERRNGEATQKLWRKP